MIVKDYHYVESRTTKGVMMEDKRAQVVINLSPLDAREFDLLAESLGFPSRAAYVVFLHRVFKTAVQLSGQEGQVLQHLGIWGYSNFRGKSPDLSDLARHCFTDEGALRKTLEKLKERTLVAEAEDLGGSFDGDVRVGDGKRCYITSAGRAAAQVVPTLQAAQIAAHNRQARLAAGSSGPQLWSPPPFEPGWKNKPPRRS